ncbi:MAG: MOSC domain-containing protein [Mucilaginibacter sp.]
MLQISGLYIYPVKSLAGIAVKEAAVTATGFKHDRRWMLVDVNNRFISQREVPQLALLQVAIERDGLLVTHKIKGNHIAIPFESSGIETTVTIWDDTCTGEYVSKEIDEWFMEVLGLNCRLVYMPDTSKRLVDQRYAPGNAITSFSDAYPFLIIGQASLDDLNSRLDKVLPVNRFRPNIVFTGGEPYGEDLFAHITIGNINFYGVKLCDRCVMTTIDQNSLAKAKEPLKTLAEYRRKGNKILFGQNLVHDGDGVIAIGDQLQIISINHEERFIINQAI